MSSDNKIGYIILEGETSYNDPSSMKVVGETNGKVVAESILQTADEVNRNRRIYPHEELFAQLQAPRTLELLNTGNLLGEMGHPLSKELVRQQTIDEKFTCVKYLKLWTEGMNIRCHYTTTNNQYGKALNEDLKEGRKPAFSLRALGSINQTPKGAVVENIKVVTWDEVIYPSHPGAYTQKIVSESTSILDPITESGNDIQGKSLLIPITNDNVLNYIRSESANLKYMRENFDFMYDSINVNESGTTVTLTDKNGAIFVVNLESYIDKEIRRYTSSVSEYFGY